MYTIQIGHSFRQLFDLISKIQNLATLVLGMSSLGLNYCFKPSRHAFYQILTHLWLYLLPYFCNPLPNLPNFFGMCWILAKLCFDVLPKFFNRIEVWRLWRPVWKSDIIVFHPVLSLVGGVFEVIILLK